VFPEGVGDVFGFDDESRPSIQTVPAAPIKTQARMTTSATRTGGDRCPGRRGEASGISEFGGGFDSGRSGDCEGVLWLVIVLWNLIPARM
jgi:hypothetical protein